MEYIGRFQCDKNDRERKGREVVVNKRDMNLFAEFIFKSTLVDIPCKGKNSLGLVEMEKRRVESTVFFYQVS